MNDILSSIGFNIVSDVVSAMTIAGILFLASTLVKRRGRKKLFDFFGLDRVNPVLHIYLSRLDVVTGGSRGTDGVLFDGFVGPALMQLEYFGAQSIERIVHDAFLDILPDPIRRLMESQSAYLRKVQTSIDVATRQGNGSSIVQIGAETVVLLGSDVYSHPVRTIYASEYSFIRFVSETTHEQFDATDPNHGEPTFALRTDGRWQTIVGRDAEREIGTIQRIQYPGRKTVLMCAGISASSTRGSAAYLSKHWNAFYDRFGDRDFLVVLAFPGQDADSHAIVQPVEIPDYERSREPIPAVRPSAAPNKISA